MNKKLIFLVISSFFLLNGCLYSCTMAPKMQSFANTDPCDSTGNSTFVSFSDVTGGAGNMTISAILRLPCKKSDGKTFTLVFFDADNLKQPSDLTNAQYDWINPIAGDPAGASCTKLENNEKVIKKYMNPDGDPEPQTQEQRDLDLLSQGVTVIMSVGLKHPGRIYPYITKIPYNNVGAIGTFSKVFGKQSKRTDCINNVNMAPFIQDPKTLSPVFQKGKSISFEVGESTIGMMYPHQLVPVSAPFYSYGMEAFPEGSEQGLISSPGITSKGSYFTFQVKLMPGNYYIAWSEVPKPLNSLQGDFRFKNINVYSKNAPSGKLDYLSPDCNKDVFCSGKATPIKVS